MKQLSLALTLSLSSLSALAGVPSNTIPEPGVLPLLAIGAVGGLVFWVRNRKK